MSDTTIKTSLVKPSSENAKAIDKEAIKAEFDEEKAIGGKKGKELLKKAGQKLSQPFVDQFHKDYGEDAVATPKSVGDFILDHAIKIGVAILTISITFAAARGKFNGFSKNFAENIKSEKPIKAIKDALDTVKAQNAQAIIDAKTIKEGASNVDDLINTVEAMTTKAGDVVEDKGLASKIGKFIKATPKESFAENSKIPKFIDKVFKKNPEKAEKAKSALLKMGIGEGSDISDLAIAASTTSAATTGTGIIADKAVDSNDENVGIQSRLETIAKGIDTLDKILG